MGVSFFLGAGASAPYGMPTTGEFIKRLLERGRGRRKWQEVTAALGASSIEELFDRLADTARYFSTDAGRSIRSRLLMPSLGSQASWLRGIPRLESSLKSRIFEAYTWNPGNKAALDTVLGPLLDLAAEQGEVPVYTTNYDRCVEEYCSDPRKGLLCHDGFDEDPHAGRFRWKDTYGKTVNGRSVAAARALKLYKLHGSLGWKLGPYGPERLAYESRSGNKHYKDLLVYPSSRADPMMEDALFRTVFTEFRGSLLSSDMCVAAGYSFRDPDIAGVFEEFVQSDRLLVMVGDGAVPDFYKNVLRVPAPAGVARRWRRAGQGRAVRIDPSLPGVYGINELVSPETILGITRSIGGILQRVGGPAAP